MKKFCPKAFWKSLMISRTTGFSLVEMIVVIAVVGVLAGVAARFLLSGFRIYNFVDQRKAAIHEARLALYWLNRDLRQVRDPDGVLVATATHVRYWNYFDEIVEYQYQDNEIERNGNTLASNVTNFQFSYQRSGGEMMEVPVSADSLSFIWNIIADFTVQIDDHSIRYHVLVHPRNY
ncbi:hypothetical protein B5M50_07075 [candidate division KSB1 bacterium 4484_219]|nr:MAG: hypothetical protein B5M50_07075 [candidate division KSB1 bacterium 4484_219]HDI51943.1 type II secretion system protein [Bacteroidota bacterium]